MEVLRSTYIPVPACGSRERSWLVLDLDAEKWKVTYTPKSEQRRKEE